MNVQPIRSPAAQDTLLLNWKALMRRGVEASRGQAPAAAQALYLSALEIATALLAAGPADHVSDDDRVAAFVVTHLNLAESFEEEGRLDEAVACLCGAHRALMDLVRGEGVPSSLQGVACRHARETHAALIKHWSEHGSHPEITAAIRDGCMSFPLRGALAH